MAATSPQTTSSRISARPVLANLFRKVGPAPAFFMHALSPLPVIPEGEGIYFVIPEFAPANIRDPVERGRDPGTGSRINPAGFSGMTTSPLPASPAHAGASCDWLRVVSARDPGMRRGSGVCGRETRFPAGPAEAGAHLRMFPPVHEGAAGDGYLPAQVSSEAVSGLGDRAYGVLMAGGGYSPSYSVQICVWQIGPTQPFSSRSPSASRLMRAA